MSDPVSTTEENQACQDLISSYPDLLTENELIAFLRIPEISGSQDYHNVIEHLKKVRGLPRIRMCNKVLFPRKAVLHWIEKETDVSK